MADDIAQQFAIHIGLDPSYVPASDYKGPLRKVVITQWDTEGGIEEAADPNYTQSEVYGRAEPYQSYSNTGARTVSFALKFHCENGDPVKEVMEKARFLDSLKYPIYNQTRKMSFAPPPVLVAAGALLNFRAIVTACTLKWNGPFQPITLYPHEVDISLTLTIVRKSDSSYAHNGMWH